MCRYFGVSRAAYYAWRGKMDRNEQDITRIQYIQEAYEKSHRTYGYRRISYWIQKHKNVAINHKAVLRIMNWLGIRSIARKRRVHRRFIDRNVFQHHYENILNREFTATEPNQKWVTDITYVYTDLGTAYLSTIKDLFDGFIVAHEVGYDNSPSLVIRTLKKALLTEKIKEGMILHSDQGFQYSAHVYHTMIQEYSIRPSMSRRGDCWDNAVIENFYGHLKEESLRHHRNPSFQQLKQIIDEYIHFYNYERIQLKTRQTPYELRCLSN